MKPASSKDRERLARRLETCASKLQEAAELAATAGITGIMPLCEQRVFELMETAQKVREQPGDKI